MPIECEADHQRKLVVTVYRGAITDQDLAGLVETLRDRVGPGADYVALTDMTDADLGGVTAEGVRMLVDALVGLRVVRSNAIHVASDLAFGLSRMISAMLDHSGIRVEVFRDRTRAEAWLGLTLDRSRPE